MADERRSASSSSHYSSKTDSTICQLKLDLTNLREKYGELRRNAEREWCRRENELRRKFQTKLESTREKWRIEKNREFENALTQAKRDYEQRLTTALQIKEKELRLKCHQNNPTPTTTNTNKKTLDVSTSSPYHSQDVSCALKISDSHHQKAILESVELRERLTVLQDQLYQSDKLIKEKDEEIKSLKQFKTNAAQSVNAESQRRIRALLEEIRRKERDINKLENSLKTVEHQLVRVTSSFCTSLNGQGDFNDTMSAKMATVSSSAAKPVNTTPNGVTREEYDKEKQRWCFKQNELESQLKASEQSNAELAQIKADLIRRMKEFEKTQKLLQDSYKKLCDKHKQTCTDLKQMDEKFKQCQEENINLKQNLEKTSTECNKLKEKRVRCDKQEEYEKLRQQTLDYCKTISALKQTNIEKDRRLDLLQQKFKRIKRCRNRTVDISFSEDDSKSSFGSDHSISSTSLNTITEDWAELPREELEANYRQLAKNYLELQRVYLSLSRCHVEFSSGVDAVDLPNKYQEALKRIEELEKLVSTTSALGADAEWAQEKLKYASLTKSLREKIDCLNNEREKLEFELQETREQNELLEFQILEFQQQTSAESPSLNSLSSKCPLVCDRSVSTSEDEGVYSFDGSDDNSDHSEQRKEFSLDDLKIRFTLLKHRKELRAEDRQVVSAVKDIWEALQNQHSHCSSNQMEWELKFRESESAWNLELESFKKQLEELSEKKKKRLKFKEVESELEICRTNLSEVQRVNVDLEKRLHDCNIELEKIQYMLKLSEDSKQRERHTVQELRTQIKNMTQGRSAEIELLENATNCQTKELDAYRRKENEINTITVPNEEEIETKETFEQTLEENKKLQQTIDEQQQTIEEKQKAIDEQKRLESKLHKQLQNAQESCRNMQQKFQDSLKTIRQLEENETKTAEELNDLISVNETLTKTVENLHEERISYQNRCTELESVKNQSEEKLRRENSELESLRLKFVEEIENLKENLHKNEILLEEKSTNERRASIEIVKQQRQLNQLKSYSKQLEAQFEIQLQTVQILKDQMIHLQKVTVEKDLQLKEIEKFYQTRDSNTENICIDEKKFLTKLQKTLQILPENFNCRDIRLINFDISVFQSDPDDPSELKMFRQYIYRLIKYLTESNDRMDQLRSETDLANREAEKANLRADKLCKQYRDTIAQIGDVKKEIIVTGAVFDGNGHKLDKCEDLKEELKLASGRQFVENIIVQLKSMLSKSCTDIEILNNLHSVLCNVIKEEEARTISPLEFSGTESEICGDKSPTLERYLNSSSSSSHSDQLSPRHQHVDHSSFEEDSLSDSCLNPVRRQKRKNAKTLRRTCSATFDERSDYICPPSFVKLESDLDDGRYVVSWGQPVSMVGIGGYKVYINGHVCKTISNALCTKSVIECTHKSNLETLSVATLSKNFRFESNPVTITLV